MMFGNALIIHSLWADVKEKHMLNRWLENEPKETLICAVTSAVSLVLSIAGVLKGILPFDIASLVIILSAVVLSALGVLNPVTGALWHNCGSVFVVVNAALLRLKDTDSAN